VPNVVVWTLRILLAAIFLFEGIDKFSERRLWVRIFSEIGVGQWFRHVTGGVECIGALLLLVPRWTRAGVVLLACTMVGALLTHVFVIGTGPQTFAVGVLLALLVALGGVAARTGAYQSDSDKNVGR
jgi:putative oxidoreductase